MSSELDIDRVLQLRSEIVDAIEKDILGPKDENELIPVSPTKKYLSGVLYPQNNYDAIELEEGKNEKDIEISKKSEQTEEPQIDQNNTHTNYPSSLGITCQVSKDTKEISLEVEYAKYNKIKPDIYDFQRTPIKDEKNKIIIIPIPMEKIKTKPKKIGDGSAAINYTIRQSNEGFIVSVFLRNTNKQVGEKIDVEQCIFQPILRLRSNNSKDKVFLSTVSNEVLEKDPKEKQAFTLLFRKRKQFAIGHSCSATWNVNEEDDQTNLIETTFIPKYEVPKIATQEDEKIKNLQALDMKFLAEISDPSDYHLPLMEIYNLYNDWISELKPPKDFEEIAEIQINECENARDRIKKGIELVSSDPACADAFRFANLVMLYQRSHADWLRIPKDKRKSMKRNKPELKGRWRLFQLAFILINIKSIAIPSDEERKYADVLWFPTGGGKTEAYLGLIAFTIGLRRLRNKGILKYGVVSFMRYTLRLLTLQQFQRATSFMCACEIVRRAEFNESGKPKWGSEPFRVGLWLGVTSTPNRLSGPMGAKAQLDEVRKNPENVTESNPYQIRSCPWCGSEISPYNYDFGGAVEHMQIFCSNKSCEFSKDKSREEIGKDKKQNPIFESRGLPVLLIDDDIYHLCPTLIIGTVDKFAQISWNWKTSSIFGNINRYSPSKGYITTNDPKPPVRGVIDFKSKFGIEKLLPPELIIQDELHLISGPLGTLTSIYETAIDSMCKNEQGISPKIIASTATTRNSPEQVKQLFNIARNKVKIFPPQGFDFGNSYFGKEISTDEEFGRLHIGVCPTSRTGLTILARIAAVILQNIRQFRYEKKYSDEELDPYFTVVSYFNSIKELATANRVFEDSVPDFMWMIQNKYDIIETEEENKNKQSLKSTPNLILEELTGRKNANEIPEILKQLDVGITSGKKPLDALLCTNMLQVGVDIDRFGVMIINGQPKLTSEYIQASGRIGRKFPGLIIASYNYLKPRDLSHYENFIYYHSTFHKNVEPVSITPFSSRARDRALLGVVVALMRQNSNLLSERKSANKFDEDEYEELIEQIKNTILNRVSNIEPTERESTETQLERKIFEFWQKRVTENNNLEYNKNPYPDAPKVPNGKYLMKSEIDSVDEEAILVPTSLREAEDEVKLKYYSPKLEDEEDE